MVADGDAHAGPDPAHEPRRELLELADSTVDELVGRADGTEPVVTPTRRRRRWVLPLRIVVSLGMLWVLFTRIPDFEWDGLIPTWTRRRGRG
jgi:hypothetical protein